MKIIQRVQGSGQKCTWKLRWFTSPSRWHCLPSLSNCGQTLDFVCGCRCSLLMKQIALMSGVKNFAQSIMNCRSWAALQGKRLPLSHVLPQQTQAPSMTSGSHLGLANNCSGVLMLVVTNLLILTWQLVNSKTAILDVLNFLLTALNDTMLVGVILKGLCYYGSEATCSSSSTGVKMWQQALPPHLCNCVYAFSSGILEEA